MRISIWHKEGSTAKHCQLPRGTAAMLQLYIQLFINHDVDAHAQRGSYGNALQVASSAGNDEVVQLLVNRGADVNAAGGALGAALEAAARVTARSSV